MSANDKELITHLARLLVRTGERYNLAAQDWTKDLIPGRAIETTTLAVLEGRIEAAGAFSRELREDIERVTTVEGLYRLANMSPKGPVGGTETQAHRLRRKLRLANDEAEMYRLKCLDLEEQLATAYARGKKHANQDTEDRRDHDPQEH